jgi:hypothetical protein
MGRGVGNMLKRKTRVDGDVVIEFHPFFKNLFKRPPELNNIGFDPKLDQVLEVLNILTLRFEASTSAMAESAS